MKYSPTDIAEKFSFVRETQANHGLMVEAIQHWSGGQFGDSWCAEFVWFVFSICFEGNPPFKRFQAVQTIYDLAKENNWLTTSPVKDDLFIYVNDVDHAHHIGIYTGDGNGIAGNTSSDGKSSNGDGVYEHGISMNGDHVKFIHYPR